MQYGFLILGEDLVYLYIIQLIIFCSGWYYFAKVQMAIDERDFKETYIVRTILTSFIFEVIACLITLVIGALVSDALINAFSIQDRFYIGWGVHFVLQIIIAEFEANKTESIHNDTIIRMEENKVLCLQSNKDDLDLARRQLELDKREFELYKKEFELNKDKA